MTRIGLAVMLATALGSAPGFAQEETIGDGVALPDSTEDAAASDFSNVQVHTDSTAGNAADDLGARAYTHGRDVYLQGERAPGDTSGARDLLAHELAHTVQQRSTATEPAAEENDEGDEAAAGTGRRRTDQPETRRRPAPE